MLKIGKLTLDKKSAKIAIGFKDGNNKSTIQDYVNRGLEIAEIRYDLFDDISSLNKEVTLFKEFSIPLIFTIRTANEGGNFNGNVHEYFSVIENNLNDFDAIDIEMEMMEKDKIRGQKIVKEVKSKGKLIIGSYHDFIETPKREKINDLLIKSLSHKANIFKIATMINDHVDIVNLTEFLLDNKSQNIIAIGMGSKGIITRVSMSAYGSLITFAKADNFSTAPNQLSLEEVILVKN